MKQGSELLCRDCRYNLAGLDASARCPECAGRLRGIRSTTIKLSYRADVFFGLVCVMIVATLAPYVADPLWMWFYRTLQPFPFTPRPAYINTGGSRDFSEFTFLLGVTLSLGVYLASLLPSSRAWLPIALFVLASPGIILL